VWNFEFDTLYRFESYSEKVFDTNFNTGLEKGADIIGQVEFWAGSEIGQGKSHNLTFSMK